MEINRLTITTESRILGDEYVRFGGEYIETCFHKGKKGALCLAIGKDKEEIDGQVAMVDRCDGRPSGCKRKAFEDMIKNNQ